MASSFILEHAFKVGDKVTVFNRAMSGRLIIEGTAIVRKLAPADHTYRVEFIGSSDEGTFVREIKPGASQDNPMTYLAEQIARENIAAADRAPA